MALDTDKPVTSFATGGKDGQPEWLEPLGDQLHQALNNLVEGGGQPLQRAKDILNGTWLGHPLHPALVVTPLGAWTTAAVLDLIGERRAADAAIGLGVVSTLPTAAAGMAQWHDTYGESRRLGLVHAMLNTAALGLYIGSLAARWSGNRGLGIGLSTVGLGVVGWSGYLGGELSYRLGVGIDRNAWRPTADDYRIAANADKLVEGELLAGEITVKEEKVPLVLLKRGDEVFAIGAVCSHWGGPLAEGRLVDDYCVECPWHKSQFDIRDGSVVQSPATAPQPRFEARVRNGNVEVRQAS